jgi:SAM-dependent methyltransferase
VPRPGTVERLSREWDELADADALWAILSNDPERRGRWDVADFFATGEREVDEVLGRADGLRRPRRHEAALDFGCGVGRLTRALADRFERVVGVDVSPEMVARARALNANCPGCTFETNVAADLGGFEDGTFDLVYSSKVLQHMSSPALACSYIAEFVRVLRPGGLVAFQLWTHVPLRRRLQPRRRLYGALAALRLPTSVLARLGLSPRGRGVGVPEASVRNVVERADASVALTAPDGEWGLWYYVVRDGV